MGRAVGNGGARAMHIELTGEAKKATQGMKTRLLFRLNAAPSRAWLQAFMHVTGVQVTNYSRDQFTFEGNTVACEFFGPRAAEVYETLQLYVTDANKQMDKAEVARRTATDAKLRRQDIEARKRQTLMLGREMFGDAPGGGEPEGGEPDAGG